MRVMKFGSSLVRSWGAMVAAALALGGCEPMGGGTQTWWIEHEEVIESYDEQYVSLDGVNYEIASSRFDYKLTWRTSEGDTFTESETDNSLPDASAGEYDRLRLRKQGDRYFVLMEHNYLSEEGTPFEVKQRMELELVSGTWADFAAGRDITARFTDQSHGELESMLENRILAEYDAALRASAEEQIEFEGLDPNSIEIEVSAERFELANEPFTMSNVAIKWGSKTPQVSVFRAWFEVDQ